MRRECMLGLVMSGAMVCAVQGADWPAFRGPDRQGHAVGEKLPVTWGPGKNVAWRKLVPGSGWSSPVIGGDRVYLTAAVPEGQGYVLTVMCYAAVSGEQIWSTPVFGQSGDAPKIHKKNSHASPTPILEGDRIYTHFGHQGIACLNREGEILWKNDSFAYAPVHGNGGSPALVDDLLIFSCDAAKDPYVLAIDKNTGKPRWKTPRDTTPKRAFSFCTPLVIEVAGQTQVILPGSDAVFAYEPKTGKAVWRVDYPEGYSVVPRPVYAHGLLFVCSGFNKPVLYAIDPSGAKGNVTQTHVRWKKDKGVPHTPSLLVVGDEVYMVADSGIASCMDAKTGEEHWKQRLGGNYSASPLFADGRIYFQNEEGEAVVIEAGKTFKEVSRNDLGERALASYAVSDGAIYLRTDKALYRIANP